MSLSSVSDLEDNQSINQDAVPEELNESLTRDELALFLEKKENIPAHFCQNLKGTYS